MSAYTQLELSDAGGRRLADLVARLEAATERLAGALPVATAARPGTGGIYDAPYHTPQHCPLCGGHLVGAACELCGMEVLL